MEAFLLTMILAPLAGSILNGLVLRSPSPKRTGVIASLAAAVSFVMAVLLWSHVLSTGTPVRVGFPWFRSGALDVQWGFAYDWLTAVMALVVTGIGTVIHVYSIGYMGHDRSPSRFFAYLNLFLFSMLVLITGDNLPVLFVGWEGVGLCSYLLIGFWFQDIEKANAGMKAFIVNRIGDAGFLIGMFLCFGMFGTLSFPGMSQALTAIGQPDLAMLNLAALFLFIGATGKSAQIPLYVWLPDAMAGPTPVSALIHAATMVTAGIYLITRMAFLFQFAADTNLLIAAIGTATALLAALIATSQNDIKKVLAYSTVSQLGLMFLALGSKAYVAAIFHVVTHAFFKALLFLGAGSVIHGMDGEQDITHMGGLRKKMPATFLTFTVGTLAIAGIPPLAGFFSKDTILFSALAGPHGTLFWVLATFASALTAFYMARLYALTFLGPFRGSEKHHPHESPAVMTIPLWILAVGSAVSGLLGVPHEFHLIPNYLEGFLSPLVPAASHHGETPVSEFAAMGIATSLAIAMVALGVWLYADPRRAAAPGALLSPLRTVFANKFWVDELYGILIVRPFRMLSAFLAKLVDPRVIDAAVLLPSRMARAGAGALSAFQLGSAQFYLFVMLVGSVAVFWFFLKGVMI